MSRSYKKERVVKDKSKSSQKQGSRNLRQKTKQKLKVKPLEEDLILPKDKSEVINDYDVTDWKFRDDDKKYFGKGKLKKINK
jgi:hypothetical protein